MVILVSAVESQGDTSRVGVRRKYARTGRLLKHSDFERVYQQGRRHFSAHMTVFYLRRDRPEGVRIGYTVSRALGGAVERNRIRRRLREAVRLNWPSIAQPIDIVINPKKSSLKAEFQDLTKEVVRAFETIQKGRYQ